MESSRRFPTSPPHWLCGKLGGLHRSLNPLSCRQLRYSRARFSNPIARSFENRVLQDMHMAMVHILLCPDMLNTTLLCWGSMDRWYSQRSNTLSFSLHFVCNLALSLLCETGAESNKKLWSAKNHRPETRSVIMHIELIECIFLGCVMYSCW